MHYLRTTNPVNPENLAVYPRRLGTNRPNPYTFPRRVQEPGRRGCSSYETRQCASGPVPTLVTQPQPGLPIDPLSLIPADLAANIQKFFFGPTAPNGAVAAPACKQQGKFPFGGEVTQYPHVNAATGPTARALARSRRPHGAGPAAHALGRWPTTAARRAQELLDEVGDATDDLGVALAALGAAFEALDDYNAERLEEELFRPVQIGLRARAAHPQRVRRAATACRTARSPRRRPATRRRASRASSTPRSPPSAAPTRALAQLQDSMRPVEVGDAELRAGLSEVRRLIADVPRRASELVRGLGR